MTNDDQKEENNLGEQEDLMIDQDSDLDDSVVAEESLQETVKKLRAKLKVSEKERLEFLTGWQKAKADFVNLRKRDEEERGVFLKTANESLILELLPVLDSIELAQRDTQAWETLPTDWRKGIESIFTQIKNTLKKAGLEEVNAMGQTLDPRFHEAIGTVATGESDEDHKVAEVFQTGYIFQGRVIRPARVRVYEHTES